MCGDGGGWLWALLVSVYGAYVGSRRVAVGRCGVAAGLCGVSVRGLCGAYVGLGGPYVGVSGVSVGGSVGSLWVSVGLGGYMRVSVGPMWGLGGCSVGPCGPLPSALSCLLCRYVRGYGMAGIGVSPCRFSKERLGPRPSHRYRY